ncbi:MAG: bacillithiol biosynthesis cysteine-adding enzyme BshC [Bacteroidota bacterium]
MFSKLISDYLQNEHFINGFAAHQPTIDGVKAAIASRKQFGTDRKLIQSAFEESYAGASPSAKQTSNIVLLASENTFTICTAHQPNIFTGYLYFIYKTAHTIALSRKLKSELPQFDFVPVFYIGSEDNDLDELSKFRINGKSFRWETNQTGAVGRMQVDKGVTALISEIEAELSHLPEAPALIALLKKSYATGHDMAEGIFVMLNTLFSEEGLLVLQPDRASLKAHYRKVMQDDLLDQVAERIVGATGERLETQYKLQVNPRSVNLFYLRDGIRNRIDKRGNQYAVDGTVIRFTEAEILAELNSNPERFSPNVILRGLYQETILPNIIFVGGGSEVAYWMQLKDLFTHYQVPFPVLVLRNSFTIMDANHAHKMHELQITDADLFKEEITLSNELVQRWASASLSLDTEEKESKLLFARLKKRAGDVDKTLVQHVHALETFHLKKMESLEKKMLKAERKKQTIELQRIWKLKSELFPNGNLQERVENFMPYYAQYGQAFIQTILQHSLALEQQFGLIIIS